jgi:hypothetical protein
MRFLFLLFMPVLLAGCVMFTTEPPFSKDEAAFIQQNGTTIVQGHLFIQHFPKPITGAGEIVRLIPVTAYSTDKIKEIFGDDKYIIAILLPKIDIDPDYTNYIRTTKAEMDGRFSFSNVPAGHYYVQSQVVWRKDGSIVPEGRMVYDDVTITGNETQPVKIILSGN